MTQASRMYPILGAVCATLFLFGCSDATTPTTSPDALFAKKDCAETPSHPSCKNGGGGDDGGSDGDGTVRAGLSGAITMASHLMTSVRDARWQLSMNTDASERGPAEWDFGPFVDPAGCTAENATVAEMLPHLTGSTAGPAGFEMSYDKRSDGASSDRHGVQLNVQDGSAVHVGFNAHGSPTATAGMDASGNETYTYSGTVRVWIKEGSPKAQPKLFCPADGTVTVTVER